MLTIKGSFEHDNRPCNVLNNVQPSWLCATIGCWILVDTGYRILMILDTGYWWILVDTGYGWIQNIRIWMIDDE